MKRLLLFLTCVLTLFGVVKAEEKTIKITTTETKAANNSTSYVTTPTNVTVDGFTFVFDEFNPSSGQMRMNNTGLSGFNLCNSTAIPGLKSIKITSNQSTLGTWYVKTSNSSKITSAATASDTKGIVNTSNTNSTVTFNIPGGSTYFMLNLTEKGSGNVYFTSIEITYEDILQDLAPSKITFSPDAESINTNTQISISADGTNPTINYSIDGEPYNQTYSAPFTLPEGTHTIYAKAWNDANKETPITASATYNVIFEEKPEIPGIGSEFELVTSDSELIEGKYYIITSIVNNSPYAISTVEKSSKVLGVSVYVNDNIATISDSETVIFQPAKENSNWIWYAINESLGGKAFGKGSGNTDTTFGTPTSNNYKSTVSFNNDGSLKLTFASNRTIRGYDGSNGADFRGYTDNSNEPIYLYRLVEAKAPALPVVTIDGEILKNKDTKTVLAGTEVSYECENATSTTATFNETPISSPFIINESGELVVYGTNEVGDGEKFTYTFTVDTKEYFPEVDSNFAQILNGEEPSEGFYIIAKGKENGTQNGIFAMSNIVSTQNNIPATSNITIEQISDNKALLTTTAEDVLIVKLIKESEQNFIKTVNLGEGFTTEQKYLSSGSVSTDLIFNDNKVPVYITITGGNNNNATLQFSEDAGTRKVALGGSANNPYFNYQQGGDVVQLYKYTTANIFKPEVEDVKLRLTENETYTLPTFENAPELTYTIAQEGDVLSISDGEIKAMNPGEAVVTVSWNESDDWFAGSTTFKVTVLPPLVDITETFGFRYPSVRGKKDVGVVSQAVYYEGDGKVEYSIWEYKFADPADKTLTPSTDVTIQDDGMIRPEDIENAVLNKVYTVKAIVAATDLYSAGEASYTFVIEAPVEASKGKMVEDLTDNNSNRWKDAEGNNYQLTGSYVDDAFKLTSNNTNIEYTIYKGCYQNKFFQLAKDPLGYISFTIPSNCKTITIGWGENSSSKTPGSLTVSIDGKDVETFEFYEDKSIDVRTKGGSTMTIKNADSNYVIRMSNLIFDIPTSAVPEAGLYFDVSEDGVEHYINVFEDETIKLPELISAEGMDFKDLIFDIDEIDEADDAETYQGYTITAKDFDDISIDINYPGVYTFRAEYNAEKLVERGELENVEKAKFLDGFAILRINVFPRLTVVPSDNHDSTLADDERTNAPELTLVQTVEEDGEETAKITLLSIEALENSFKYSTIKIVKVEIKHGTESITYEGDELANLDPEIKFTEDGYVKYTVRYANTEDFQAESTVHVVLMPKTSVDRSEDNKITLTPSKNAKLKYAYVHGNDKKEIKRRATVIPNDEWEEADGNHVIDDVEGLKNEGVTAIFYKTEKDLSSNQDMVDNKAVPTNPILADEGTIVLATVPVELNIGTIEEQPFKTNSHTYTLSDIINFNNSYLEVGKDFTVTVTPKDNAEGWSSTEVTGNELNAAYQKAFANIQGEETGLYDQYTSLNTEYVDGFYTGVTNLKVTEGTEANSFTISADLPCSGVYVVTVAPVSGTEFTFDQASTELTVYPNLQGTFGADKGFNIEGYTFGNDTDNGGFYTISFPDNDYEFVDNMLCYIPGTYFANGLTVSSTDYVTPTTSSNNDVYFATVNLEKMNTETTANVFVTISKNGASHQYEFVVNKSGNVNESTDVESIETEDGETVYYDLNGFKVDADRLEKGIYIKVTGNKATKVIL